MKNYISIPCEMDKIYVGILLNWERRILALSRNREKVAHAIYRYFILEENIFSDAWSSYHSMDIDQFRREFSWFYAIPRFEERMNLYGSDQEYNEEFVNDLVELPVINRYISPRGSDRYIIEEHELIS